MRRVPPEVSLKYALINLLVQDYSNKSHYNLKELFYRKTKKNSTFITGSLDPYFSFYQQYFAGLFDFESLLILCYKSYKIDTAGDPRTVE